MTINTNTIRIYNASLKIDTGSADKLNRHMFIIMARAEAEKLKRELHDLMLKEYDERQAELLNGKS